jgi:hypothetical protein
VTQSPIYRESGLVLWLFAIDWRVVNFFSADSPSSDIQAVMPAFWYSSLLANSIAGRSVLLYVSNTDAIALYEIIRNQPSADSEA